MLLDLKRLRFRRTYLFCTQVNIKPQSHLELVTRDDVTLTYEQNTIDSQLGILVTPQFSDSELLGKKSQPVTLTRCNLSETHPNYFQVVRSRCQEGDFQRFITTWSACYFVRALFFL